MKLYRFLYTLFAPVFRLFYRIKVTGIENIPDGASVVCANHTSMLDPIFAAIAFGKKDPLIFMSKIEIFRWPVVGAIMRGVKAIPVDRGSTSVSTLREAINGLKENRKIMIFPEGTRVREGDDPVGAKTGAAMIACRGKAPMLPVFISGKKRLFGKVNVIIGKAIETESFEGTGSAKYKAVVDSVFGEILSLGRGGEQ